MAATSIHIGVVIVVVGLAGAAFNASIEKRNGPARARSTSGPYTLEQVGSTQDSNLNYDSEYALLDVYKGGKKVFQMTPEKRFYLGEAAAADHGGDSFDSGMGSCMWCMRARIPTPGSRSSRRF